MKNKKFYILHFTFYILFLVVTSLSLLSCSSPTESSTGSLSGNIHLQGESDHSDITVALYNLVELDTTITRINAEYPHIGIKISQHTEFDHRFAEPIGETETDANGNFKIKDIPTGRYNLVAMKQGFGFRYIHNVQINEGSNSLSNFTFYILNFTLDSKEHTKNTADLTLFPETYIHEDITAPTTFESYHHYIITDDIWVYDDLTIEPGAVIRLAQGVGMTICEKLTAVGQENNWIWFTSNDSLSRSAINASDNLHYTFTNPQLVRPLADSPPKSELELFNKVELSGTSDKEVRFCKFDNAGTGLLSTVNGFAISNCIFRNSLCGFHAEGADSVFCSNLLCEDITGESGGGIYYSNARNGSIEKSIFCNCYNGSKIKDRFIGEFKNNYASGNHTGLLLASFNGLVKNNDFELNQIDINYAYNYTIESNQEGMQIEYNNFRSPEGFKYIVIPNYVLYSHIEISHNNFYNTELYIAYNSRYIHPPEYLEATHNYFNGIDDIAELLIINTWTEELENLELEPILTNEVLNTGIQGG